MTYYPPTVIIPIYAIFATIGVSLLAVRLWVRVALSPVGLGMDDILSVVSVIFVSSCTSIQIWNASSGTGGNVIDDAFREAQVVTADKVNTAQAILEVLAVGTIKLSLLFFYHRIFGVMPSFSQISLACIWLVGIWMVTFAIAQMSICGTRMYYLWTYDQTFARDYCGDKALLLLVFAVTSIVTDLIVLGLPTLYLRKVQMPAHKKWPATFIFLLGAISTFACILRTVFLCVAWPIGAMEFGYISEPGHEAPEVMQIFNPTFWIMIEMWLGSWAANLLPIGPLYLSVFVARRQRNRGPTLGGNFSQVYEMGSRRDKVRDVSAVEELDAASDSAPIMTRSRDASQLSL